MEHWDTSHFVKYEDGLSVQHTCGVREKEPIYN